MMPMKIHTDCRHFRGDMPCVFHKKTGAHCEGCADYDPLKERILIIKLGAIGDVIRSTPLLHRLKAEHPKAQIIWLTQSPDILPSGRIDRILGVNPESITWLQANRFDWLINLDKDALAISLAQSVKAKRKSGFEMDGWGRCQPVKDQSSVDKWLTGLWDDANQANTKHYMEEMFEICGFDFRGEEYILEDPLEGETLWHFSKGRKKIGLNTGCGGRWTSRLWPEESWIELAQKLIGAGYEPVLLGGKQEDEKNQRIARASGALYPGHYDLKTFIHLVNGMDSVVTAVTMAMHLAIGLKKQLVLFNNIFNRNEFYLYDRGVILEPEMACDCYFSPTCKNNCMTTLKVDTVFVAVKALAGDTPSWSPPEGGEKGKENHV